MNQSPPIPVKFRSRFEYTQAMAYVRAGSPIPDHLLIWPSNPEYATAKFIAPTDEPTCQCQCRHEQQSRN